MTNTDGLYMIGGQSVVSPLAEPGQAESDNVSPTQEMVLDLLDGRPGANIVRVAEELGFTHSTATYHLNTLVRRGLVRRQREGRMVRHFVAGDQQDYRTAHLRALLRDERKQRIVAFVVQEHIGRYTINQMARILGVPFSSMKSVLSSLEKAGLVEMECVNGRYRIRKNGDLEVAFAKLIAAQRSD